MPRLEILNFIIAVLALLVAIYSIYYTHRFNRRKIFISSGEFHSDSIDPPIAFFEICNLSPVPVTILDINFFTQPGNSVRPLENIEPTQTYSESQYSRIADMIPEYKYAEPLEAPQVLPPYESVELSYYFDKIYDCLSIKVVCDERIHCFKRHQSFSVHFSDIQE